jgi:monovalent cation:proton antiporter-2 (CPA2) family protein
VGQITLVQVAVLLAAAGLVAPLAKHFRIGAVLGYLFAGMVIGPFGLRIFSDADRMLHVAEFGVVLLLFLIGLELKPQRLLAMRKSVVGAGGTQVLVTAVALFAIVMAAGYDWRLALFVGLALSLSSTAMVLQVLKEKGELEHRHGRLGFAVLLFQDIAAIPMIAFVGLLAVNSDAAETMTWWGAIKALGALCAVVLAGRYIVGWVFHLIAKTGVSEAMTAFALLLIVVIEIIFKGAGLSPALGAFIAGALLAESAYRHEIEADIKPFESLLLGLFFVAVGMSLNLNLLISNPGSVMLAAAGLIVLKGIILFVIARRFGLDVGASRRFAVALAQGGEFAFVLTTGALAASVIMRDQAVFINIVFGQMPHAPTFSKAAQIDKAARLRGVRIRRAGIVAHRRAGTGKVPRSADLCPRPRPAPRALADGRGRRAHHARDVPVGTGNVPARVAGNRPEQGRRGTHHQDVCRARPQTPARRLRPPVRRREAGRKRQAPCRGTGRTVRLGRKREGRRRRN